MSTMAVLSDTKAEVEAGAEAEAKAGMPAQDAEPVKGVANSPEPEAAKAEAAAAEKEEEITRKRKHYEFAGGFSQTNLFDKLFPVDA